MDATSLSRKVLATLTLNTVVRTNNSCGRSCEFRPRQLPLDPYRTRRHGVPSISSLSDWEDPCRRQHHSDFPSIHPGSLTNGRRLEFQSWVGARGFHRVPCCSVCEIRAMQTVESSLAWALHKSLCCCREFVVVEPHLGHRCTVGVEGSGSDDPPRQDGEPSKRQLVQCVVACVRALALWMSS